ncbi:hypothetical protein K2173_020932 [Erythroxylum novogranatense]|uniref:Large ribosomal subunit protein bL32c n=1 Tax=Erythroxylum novogranatense TaxID=1862640 RepID=A0AAV8TM23_9ROSI|nr:hypothetical protein K2173_020932 [Erythroxylum novogranatense]
MQLKGIISSSHQAKAVAMAATATPSILTASPTSHQHFLSQNAVCCLPSSLQLAFRDMSLKFPRQSLSRSLAATSPKKPLPVVAVTRNAVSFLEDNHSVEGVVTLTHEDDGAAEATIVDNQVPSPNAVIERALMVHEFADDLGPVAAVPKKRTSKSKKRIRKNIWKRKAYWTALKAYSLAKSIATGKSKSFWSNSGKVE